MPAEDVTVTANWTANFTEFVEIVFATKDLKEKDVRETIKKYSDSEFAIVKFVGDEETGGTRVIVKFEDRKSAENFIEEVRASSDAKGTILKARFFYGESDSFSSSLCPLYLFDIILYF